MQQHNSLQSRRNSTKLIQGSLSKKHNSTLGVAQIKAPSIVEVMNITSQSLAPTTTTNLSARPVLELGADRATTRALADLADAVTRAGGRAVVVGGAVRDLVAVRLGRKTGAVKDIDVEVFGLDPHILLELLTARGQVDVTGAAFQVLKVPVQGAAHPLDVSVPRREETVGSGHRDFLVTADPTMSFKDAARRRDFTIGAMGFDPLTGELLDPYGGMADLTAGILRHVSEAFDEDPLRALRAARMAARFALTVETSTVQRCQALAARADALPSERIWDELAATIAQAPKPGEFFRVLDQIGWVEVFSEVAALRGVEQDPTWHPEGDAFVHTMHVLDYWSEHERTSNPEDDLIVAIAALCHDLGKAMTTEHIEGRWRAHGHEAAGEAPTIAMLHRLGQVRLAAAVVPLVVNHLAPVQLHAADATDRAVRRLSTRVSRLDLLTAVSVADAGGRPPLEPTRAIEAREWLLDAAERLGVTRSAPVKLARGEHLIALGLKPGPIFRQLLDTVYDAQLDGEVTSEEQAEALLKDLITSHEAELTQGRQIQAVTRKQVRPATYEIRK